MSSIKKPVRLRNKYSNEIVFCEDYDNVFREVAKSMDFIRVYTEKDPKRTYLANKEAFEVLSDK
jgi:hypothetical protein